VFSDGSSWVVGIAVIDPEDIPPPPDQEIPHIPADKIYG